MLTKALVACAFLLVQAYARPSAVEIGHSGRFLLQRNVPAIGKIMITKTPGPKATFLADLSQDFRSGWYSALPNKVDGYCVDTENFIDEGKEYCTAFCSSIDRNFDSCNKNILKDKIVNYNYTNIDQVNWLLNNYEAGQLDGETNCFGQVDELGVKDTSKVFTVDDIQEAIWEIAMAAPVAHRAETCRGKYLAALAKKKGRGFLPSACWEKVAVLALAYNCNKVASFNNVQVVAFFATLKELDFICVPTPQCTKPKLPEQCVGVTYGDILKFLGNNTTPTVLANGRRSLSCAECVRLLDAKFPEAAPHAPPEGCQCPTYPCCNSIGITGDESCPPCPAIAQSSSFSLAVAGPGGCASAQSFVQGKSISGYDVKATVFDPLVPVITQYSNTPPDGRTIAATAAKVSNILARATARAVIRWFQYGCSCSKFSGSGYSESLVTARVQATATAVARAFSAVQAQILDERFPGAISFADAQAEAIASSTEIALNRLVPQLKTATTGQCFSTTSMGQPAIQTTMVKNVANALACTVTRALATVFYTDLVNPLSPTPNPDAKSCSCSFSFAGLSAPDRGDIDPNTVCPNTCPLDDSGCTCPGSQKYDPTQMACTPAI